MAIDLYRTSANPNPGRILRIDEVLHRTGLKRTMLYDLIAKRRFPKQFSLGARAVGWYEEQVEEWIKDRSGVGGSSSGRQDILNSEILAAATVSNMPLGLEDSQFAQHPPKRGHEETSQSRKSRSVEPPKHGHAARDGTSTPLGKASIQTEELERLRDENARLKRLIADLMLKNDVLQSKTAK